jgi:hypothetical protein
MNAAADGSSDSRNGEGWGGGWGHRQARSVASVLALGVVAAACGGGCTRA